MLLVNSRASWATGSTAFPSSCCLRLAKPGHLAPVVCIGGERDVRHEGIPTGQEKCYKAAMIGDAQLQS